MCSISKLCAVKVNIYNCFKHRFALQNCNQQINFNACRENLIVWLLAIALTVLLLTAAAFSYHSNTGLTVDMHIMIGRSVEDC